MAGGLVGTGQALRQQSEQLYGELAQQEQQRKQYNQQQAASQTGSTVSGAISGAALGNMILPGWGALIGAPIGGLIGHFT